jgi:hypothetical protein
MARFKAIPENISCGGGDFRNEAAIECAKVLAAAWNNMDGAGVQTELLRGDVREVCSLLHNWLRDLEDERNPSRAANLADLALDHYAYKLRAVLADLMHFCDEHRIDFHAKLESAYATHQQEKEIAAQPQNAAEDRHFRRAASGPAFGRV